jgi:hypothetical protein
MFKAAHDHASRRSLSRKGLDDGSGDADMEALRVVNAAPGPRDID